MRLFLVAILLFPTKRPTNIMIGSSNRYSRNEAQRQEDRADVDQELARLEEDIRRLKIEFDIYFNGATKRPPLATRARLESQMKRIADNRGLTFAQRYFLNTLTSRFTSYRELWRRNLKAKGEEL